MRTDPVGEYAAMIASRTELLIELGELEDGRARPAPPVPPTPSADDGTAPSR